eukprot:TRINITY_DN10040_c0_g2_i4.p2 TRINITY_DN10040_c0_g2~~TRINITY_DN10040_c0_g2_i4.p2  ORF type:complete len:146 (+),score=8.72 TRINITY_DN10040_c0_g2_i4:28-438(+)
MALRPNWASRPGYRARDKPTTRVLVNKPEHRNMTVAARTASQDHFAGPSPEVTKATMRTPQPKFRDDLPVKPPTVPSRASNTPDALIFTSTTKGEIATHIKDTKAVKIDEATHSKPFEVCTRDHLQDTYKSTLKLG